MLSVLNSLPESGSFWTFLLLHFSLSFVLNLILASATFSDARLQQARGGGLFLVGPTVWFLAVLFGGLLAVALYWLVHHSRLRSTVHHPTAPPNNALQRTESGGTSVLHP